jgi:hypothetical protein
MKYAKCIYKGEFSGSSDLTVGKIYEVVNHNSDTKPHNNESIDIITDKNELRNYYLIDTDNKFM